MPYMNNASSPSFSLVHLDLAENQLDGEIPLWWFNSTTELRYLSLQDNKMVGAIPVRVRAVH